MHPEVIELYFLSDIYSTIHIRVMTDNKGKEKNMKTLYFDDESDILDIVREALEVSTVALSNDSLAVLKSGDAAAILAFLKEQSGAAAALSKSHHEQTMATFETLPTAKHKALDALFNDLWYAGPVFEDAKVLLYDTDSFSQRLVFKGLGLIDYDHNCSLETFVFTHKDGKYVLELLQTDYSDEGEGMHLASVTFEDFDILNECYNYFDTQAGSHGHLAWSLVDSALQSLCHKHDLLGAEYINEAEKELLTEAQSFTYEKYRKADALPIWKSVRQKLFDATRDYPHRQDKPLITSDERNRIESAILNAGFSGDYPHFYKMTDIDGYKLRLVHSTPYLYTRDKNVLNIIDIIETRHGIHFASGIILNKRIKNERLSEISALEAFFDDGPYRIGEFLTLPAHELSAEGADKHDLLTKTVGAILKLSAMKRLTKQELSELPITSGAKPYPLRVLIIISFVFGIAFSLLFCAGMAALCFIIGAIFGGGIAGGTQLLASIPWYRFFIFSALGAGGLMAIVMVLAKDK